MNIHGKRRHLGDGKTGEGVKWEQVGGILNKEGGRNESTHIVPQTTACS